MGLYHVLTWWEDASGHTKSATEPPNARMRPMSKTAVWDTVSWPCHIWWLKWQSLLSVSFGALFVDFSVVFSSFFHYLLPTAGRDCDPRTQFRCVHIPQCVDIHFHCDLDPDCADGTDEECSNNTCKNGYYRCHTGRCIPGYWVCDGDPDCDDQDDEPDKCDNTGTVRKWYSVTELSALWTNDNCTLNLWFFLK